MSLLGAIGGAIGGFLTGGPGGAIIGGLAGYSGSGGGTPGTSVVRSMPTLPVPGGGGLPMPGGFNFGGRSGPGTIGGIPIMAPGYGFGGKLRGRVPPQNGQCPRGWHLNKHTLSDGTGARSMCVRNRTMNPLNPRALKRALTREKRAGKIIRRLHIFHAVHRVAAAPKGRFLPRKK